MIYCTLHAEPAFPHSPPSSMLFFCQSVLLENTSWVWLFFCWACAKFSWQHKDIFNQSIWPLTTIKKCTFEGLWNGTLVCYISSKDSHNGMHGGMYQKNRSNQSKSTEGLESSPSFWMRHFKRSVKPSQSWLTRRRGSRLSAWTHSGFQILSQQFFLINF